jgi:hypothetical protein
VTSAAEAQNVKDGQPLREMRSTIPRRLRSSQRCLAPGRAESLARSRQNYFDAEAERLGVRYQFNGKHATSCTETTEPPRRAARKRR